MSVTYPQYALSFPSEKEPAASLPTLELCRMPKLLLPLFSADGQLHTPLVESYDTVTRGQPLTDSPTPLLSPVTGAAAGARFLSHPLFGEGNFLELGALSLSEEEGESADVFSLSEEEILSACRSAGIIDELDGAFLADKLQAFAQSRPAFLAGDAVDDQPYGSAGLATLRKSGALCADGLMLAAKAIGAADYAFFLRADKESFKEIQSLLPEDCLLPDKKDTYPHKITVKGKPCPAIGVQACLALYRACAFGETQGFTTVTVAGDAVSLPSNVLVPFGTPLSEVFSLCGLVEEPDYYVMGDSFTGVRVDSDELPILPGTTCVLALKKSKQPAVHACIGCGRCAAVCHKHLLPYEIARRVESLQFAKLPALAVNDCDGCNACSVVCPANRPVADRVKQGIKESERVLLNWEVHEYD